MKTYTATLKVGSRIMKVPVYARCIGDAKAQTALQYGSAVQRIILAHL